MEAHQQHGLNIVSFQMVTEDWCWFIVGCYLDPYKNYSIKCVVGAMEQLPYGDALMVTGDISAEIADPEGNKRDRAIVSELADAGLEAMS